MINQIRKKMYLCLFNFLDKSLKLKYIVYIYYKNSAILRDITLLDIIILSYYIYIYDIT